MELTLHFVSIDKTVRSNRVQGLKHFNSQSLASQVGKKREILVSMVPGNNNAFDLLIDDKLELSTKTESSKIKITSYDEK